MTSRDIDLLPESDQAVTWASHRYYRALLRGKPAAEREQLRRLWLQEIHRRWPDLAVPPC